MEALFDLNLGQTSKLLSTPIYFDIGIPGLGLEIPHTDEQEPTVDVNLGWGFNLGFGVSRMDGFFWDTSAENELNVDVTATIPGFQAVGTLGFLQLDVTDDQADPSRLEMGFAIDITDLQGGNDRLTWNEMTSQGFDPFKMVDATARKLRRRHAHQSRYGRELWRQPQVPLPDGRLPAGLGIPQRQHGDQHPRFRRNASRRIQRTFRWDVWRFIDFRAARCWRR